LNIENTYNADTIPKKALIIGNTYKDSENENLLKLPCCEQDIDRMKIILEKKNFQVNFKKDLNYKKMVKVISEFKKSINKGDIVLFYYSGHGISYDGFHCFLPTDYDGDIETIKKQTISFVDIFEMIIPQKPFYKIFLLDCCRNRPHEKIQTKGISKESFSSLSATQHGSNIIIASSTAESTDSIGNINQIGMSLWTSYLVDELSSDTPVTLQKCLMNVRKKK